MSSSRRPSKKPTRARGQSPGVPLPTKRTPPGGRKATPKATPKAAPKPAPKPLPKLVPTPSQIPTPRSLPTRPAIPPPPRPGIRLAGSASSRLTIKPSPSQGPRPQLQLSTRVRPSGQRPLSEVDLDEDEVLIDGFDAVLQGQRVRITAVLERTCVYVDRGGDRRLARKEDLMVEADKLPIRRRGLT